MQKYIQQTGNAHPNYEYIVIIRVRTQHVQVVLSTSTTHAHYCGRQVYLLALARTSASLGQLGASTFNDCTARGISRWKCHPFHIPLCISIGGSRGAWGHVPPPPRSLKWALATWVPNHILVVANVIHAQTG